MRKMVWLLCLMTCLAAGSPKAAAAENQGTVQINVDVGDMPVINGAVTLYQVGTRMEDGYRIADGFGGGIVRQDETDSRKLAQWLAETAEENGRNMLLDADGTAFFSDLEEGLYILVQTERIDGFYPIFPILFTVPKEEQWNIEIYREPIPVVTEIPQTGQSPIPFLGILGMVLSSIGLLLCVRLNKES